MGLHLLNVSRNHSLVPSSLCFLCVSSHPEACVGADTMDLQANGCIVNLDAEGAGRRMQQHGFLTTKIGAHSSNCPWDEFDDIAGDVDKCVQTAICTGCMRRCDGDPDDL